MGFRAIVIQELFIHRKSPDTLTNVLTSGTKFSLSIFEGITSYHKINLNLNFLRARRHIRLEHHSSIGTGLRLPRSSSSKVTK